MFKFVVLCAALAVARAGYLGAPAAVGYAGYAAPAVAYSAPVAAPAIVGQHSNILRTYGNLGQVSTYSKTIDTPFSSVSKSDVRVSNPGFRAVAPIAAVAPAVHATTYHGNSLGLAAPAAVGYAGYGAGYGYGARAGLGYAGHLGYGAGLGYSAGHVGLGYAGSVGYAGHGAGYGLGYAARAGYGYAGHLGFGARAGLGYAGHVGYGAGYAGHLGYAGHGLGYAAAGYGVHPATAHVSYTSNYGSYGW